MNTFFDCSLDRSNPTITHSQALSSDALKNFAKDINFGGYLEGSEPYSQRLYILFSIS